MGGIAFNYFQLLNRCVEPGEGFEHSRRSPRGTYNGQPLGNTVSTQPLTHFKRKKKRVAEGELDFEGATGMRDMTNNNEGSRTTMKTQNIEHDIQIATREMTTTITTRNRRTEGWKGCRP